MKTNSIFHIRGEHISATRRRLSEPIIWLPELRANLAVDDDQIKAWIEAGVITARNLNPKMRSFDSEPTCLALLRSPIVPIEVKERASKWLVYFRGCQ